MTDDELTGELFEAIAEEIADCRRWHGSAWTDEWDKRLVARWEELGGTLAAVDLAGDLIAAEFRAADTQPGPRGIVGGVEPRETDGSPLEQFNEAMARIEAAPWNRCPMCGSVGPLHTPICPYGVRR